MKLTAAFATKVLKEADSTNGLSFADIRARLCDALDDTLSGGEYGYIQDIFGDQSSGDVVYCCGGDMYKAPYEISSVNGKAVASIDTDSAVDVVPRTIYEEEADEADYYSGMEAALVRAELYTELPLYERFISKSERDAADSSDFAGKGKSYPILKPGDIMAAVRSMGRAGASNLSPTGLKKRIIAIAKRKGWTKYLPKAWQGGSESSDTNDNSNSSESLRGYKYRFADDPIRLFESAAALETIVLTESSARPTVPIKVIAPGAGSSAFYPKEVLQRDGPKVFKAGTHVYVNHPTAAEEAARPEGDVTKLAGILATDAVWRESFEHKGKDLGPGLYSEVKPFSDHANLFNEKGEFLGMSIRASGKAESGAKKNGLPVLTALTSAESVDVVTRAGAGGMILQESAKPNEGATEMTAEEINKLVEAGVRKATLPTIARDKAFDLLEGVNLPDPAKRRVVARAVATLDLSEALDEKKLGEAVAAEAKAEGEYLAEVTGGSGRVFGMGPTQVTPISAKEAKREKKEAKESRKDARRLFESLGMPEDAAKYAARGRKEVA